MTGKVYWRKKNLNLANNIFEEKVKSVLEKMAPMKISQIKNKNKKWITKSTRDEMKARDSARIRAKNSQLTADWNCYKSLRNRCSKLAKTDKNAHFEKLFNENKDNFDIKKTLQLCEKPARVDIRGSPTSTQY